MLKLANNSMDSICIGNLKYLFRRFYVFAVLSLIIAIMPTQANAINGTDIYITDVTPSSFTVIGDAKVQASWSLNIYSDALGSNLLTNLTVVNTGSSINGIMRSRISGLDPDTAYFFRTYATPPSTGIEEQFPPLGAPLLGLKTQKISAAVSNDTFSAKIQQSVSSFAQHSILIMRVDGSPYPLSTVAVPGSFPYLWLINANNFYGSDDVNRELMGGESIDVIALGGTTGYFRGTSIVPVNNNKGNVNNLIPSVTFLDLGTETDSDADGIPDWYEAEYNLITSDGDADNDGITDLEEYQYGTNPNLSDTDGDGWTDDREINTEGTSAIYADSDFDGLEDDVESTYGTDPLNGDSDNDGFSDGDEVAASTNPNDTNDFPIIDTDNDGVADLLDNCALIPNADQVNLDNDAFGDACDDDIDGDGVLNNDDNAPTISNADQLDTDGDGIGDVADNCANDYNPAQLNTDKNLSGGDVLGDICDADDDADTILDYQALTESIVAYDFTQIVSINGTTFNLQSDSRATIEFSKLDPNTNAKVLLGRYDLSTFAWTAETLTGADLTSTGWLNVRVDITNCNCIFAREDDTITLVTDVGEIEVHFPSSSAVNYDVSSDWFVSDDGSMFDDYNSSTQLLISLLESAVDNLPLDNCRVVPNLDQIDSDGDGLGDACDFTPEDLDGDLILNENDNCPDNYNPIQEDFDLDSIGDICDTDADNDGLLDDLEVLVGTNPLQIDSDGDGISDGNEDYDFDGVSNQSEVTQGSNILVAEGFYTAGFNQFHYPYNVPDTLTAFGLLAELGGNTVVSSLQRRNPTVGTIETAQYNGFTQEGTNFPIIEGEGYLLQAVTAFTKSFNAPVQCYDIDLAQGLNLIGLSCIPDNFSAYDLLQNMGGDSVVSSIQRFNKRTGLFETATFLGVDPVGDDFPLSNTESYLVHSKQATTVPLLFAGPAPLTNLSVTDGMVINEKSLTITGTVNDPNTLVSINGQFATVTGNTFSVTINGLVGGINQLEIIAIGSDNIRTTRTMSIDVVTAPVITINSHSEGATVNQTHAVIFGSSDIPLSEVRVNGNLAQLSSETTFYYGVTTPYLNLVDGENQISIVATGVSGKTATPQILTLNRQSLVVDAVNPGIVNSSFQLSLPESFTSIITDFVIVNPTDKAGAGNIFFEPIEGRVGAIGVITNPLPTVLNIPFELELFNQPQGIFEKNVTISLRNISGSDVYTLTVPLSIVIPLSTSGPDITMTDPTDGDVIRFSQIRVSGVSEAAVEVTVNGIQAEIIGNVFSVNNVPLEIGNNTIQIEAKGEGFFNGDPTDVARRSVNVEVVENIFTVAAGGFYKLTVRAPDYGFSTNGTSFGLVNVEPNPLYLICNAVDFTCQDAGITDLGTGEVNLFYKIRTGSSMSGIFKDEVFHDASSVTSYHIPIKVTALASTTAIPVSSPHYPLADSIIQSAQTPVTVKVDNDTSATVVINGVTANQRHADKQLYTSDVSMLDGSNIISVDVMGTNGVSSATYQYNLNLVQQLPPVVAITSHTDGETLTTDPVTIVATVDDPTAVLTLFVNGINKSSPTIAGNVATWSNVLISNNGSNELKIMDQNYSTPVAQITLNLVQPPQPKITVTSHYNGQAVLSPITLAGTVNDPNASFTITESSGAIEPIVVPLTQGGGKGEFSVNLALPKFGNNTFNLETVGSTSLQTSRNLRLFGIQGVINAGSTISAGSHTITMTSQENRKASTIDASISYTSPATSSITVVVDNIDTVSNAPNWVVNYSISTTPSTPLGVYTIGVNFTVRDKRGNAVITSNPGLHYFSVQ